MKKSHLKIASAALSAMMLMSTAVAASSGSNIPTAAGIQLSKDADEDWDYRNGIDGFVERMYSVCLDREADNGGLFYWEDQLVHKKDTGVSAAHGFIFSEEFQSKRCSDRQYVSYMYQAFFGRPVADAELDYWTAEMGKGMTREEVFSGFANSTEFFELCESYGILRGDYIPGLGVRQVAQVNLFVDRLYTNVLQRTCDANGMTYWTQELLGQRLTGAGVADGFVFSDEFKARNLCDHCYVNVLYRAFMGREADVDGRMYWVDQMADGMTREEVFNGYVQSAEFTQICEDYGILRGDPEAVGNTVPTGPCTNGHESGDENGIRIASFNDEFKTYVDGYTNVAYGHFDIVGSDKYETWLSGVMASGDGAPDLFACDTNYARRFIESGDSLPLSDLGITESELGDMFPSTITYGSDRNGVLKSLTWQCTPCVVFYNTRIAQETLGVSAPSDVAPYFATWDAFVDTARAVAESGDYRIVSGIDDIDRSYLANRTTGWGSNGNVNIDSALDDIFSIDRLLIDEDLTWDTAQWSGQWESNAANRSTMSYWGPLWLGTILGISDDSKDNASVGEWRVVSCPTPWFWGGTWIMASRYCRDTEGVAQIMRDITINPTNIRNMFDNYKDFYNNVPLMTSVAGSTDGNVRCLGGQNPYSYLLDCANDYGSSKINDTDIENEFLYRVRDYGHGLYFDSVDEAEAEFVRVVTILGLV